MSDNSKEDTTLDTAKDTKIERQNSKENKDAKDAKETKETPKQKMDKMFKKFKRGAKRTSSMTRDGVKGGAGMVAGLPGGVLNKVDKHRVVMSMFRTGNIVQLISRTSGHCLQMIRYNGELTLDGNGVADEEHKGTLWTVTLIEQKYVGKVTSHAPGPITVQLRNDNHFLVIADGLTKVVTHEEVSEAAEDTYLSLSRLEQFIMLESPDDGGHHVGVLSNGDLKIALATGTEMDSHFAPKLIFSAPAEAAEVVNGEQNGEEDEKSARDRIDSNKSDKSKGEEEEEEGAEAE